MSELKFPNIKTPRDEITKLLEEDPTLVPLQEKIDLMLSTAGNQNNRQVLLQTMMFDNMKELQKSLLELANLLNGVGKTI